VARPARGDSDRTQWRLKPAPTCRAVCKDLRSAGLKQADVGYKELVRRLNEHGLREPEDSISRKLARGTFAATFFLACLAVLELEAIALEDL
jgi:hypothetical protein